MQISTAQRQYIGLVLVITVASVIYHALDRGHLEQTSLLFIGIPAILAVGAALTSQAKTFRGQVFRTVTLALLLAGPLLGEGFICLLMSAPIFYCVAIVVVEVFEFTTNKKKSRVLSIALLVPFMLEGATPYFSFPREEFVSASRVVAATPAQIEIALAGPPRVSEPLPVFLRIGFPRPVEAHGSGLQVGDLRVIHFAGGEGRPGDLTMRIAVVEPGRVLFFADKDQSKIAHWLDWRSSEVTWNAIDATHTRVTWKIGFTRRLDPAWYFRPWERLAAEQAAEYLIQANATPEHR